MLFYEGMFYYKTDLLIAVSNLELVYYCGGSVNFFSKSITKPYKTLISMSISTVYLIPELCTQLVSISMSISTVYLIPELCTQLVSHSVVNSLTALAQSRFSE